MQLQTQITQERWRGLVQEEGAGISVGELSSPVGPLLAAATESGVCALEFSDGRRLEVARLSQTLGQPLVNRGSHPLLKQLAAELGEYFAGTRTDFSVPLDLRGTAFQREAWGALQRIPFGQTWSYSQQALALGNPRAVRAVAQANGRNPISIVVPCHRVIGANGTLTGYGGKLWRKQWLLEREGAV